jgi:hypothetical protein
MNKRTHLWEPRPGLQWSLCTGRRASVRVHHRRRSLQHPVAAWLAGGWSLVLDSEADETKRRGAGFAVAWQKQSKKDSDDVKYMYGLYEDVEGFFQVVVPEDYRQLMEQARQSNLLDRLQSCAGDTKTEEESEDAGSCGERADPPRERRKIVPKRGRAIIARSWQANDGLWHLHE